MRVGPGEAVVHGAPNKALPTTASFPPCTAIGMEKFARYNKVKEDRHVLVDSLILR